MPSTAAPTGRPAIGKSSDLHFQEVRSCSILTWIDMVWCGLCGFVCSMQCAESMCGWDLHFGASSLRWAGSESVEVVAPACLPLYCRPCVRLQGQFVELGEIRAAHGIKGEVKVDVATDSPKQRFGKAGTK